MLSTFIKTYSAPLLQRDNIFVLLGSEWQYVIFSTASSTIDSSQHGMNLIVDEHEINVAITRASQGLIIIGKLTFDGMIVWFGLFESMLNVPF